MIVKKRNGKEERRRGEKKIEKKRHQGINNYINVLCSEAWRLVSSLSCSLNLEQTGCVVADKSKYLLNYRISQIKSLLHQSSCKRASVAAFHMAWRRWQRSELSFGKIMLFKYVLFGWMEICVANFDLLWVFEGI